MLGVLPASLTSAGSSDLTRFWLVRPYKLRLNPTDLPCSPEILRQHASGKNPGSTSENLPSRFLKFRLPQYGIESATPNTIDFGAMFPFTCIPAY